MTASVRIDGARLLIDDVPSIALCASLFPFRVPRAQWAERLLAVKGLGYNAIDVIVPWNFHELTPGEFSFQGERDIDHFLSLAVEADLLVMARPGPYICSEYDGGGLPAWLGTVDGLRIRQNEPLYLARVEEWFDQILPILSARQVQHGGPVALVQLENELDFFACEDPGGYMTALKRMADGHGITVPLIACAGQGDLERATGEVAGVVPAVNLYPDDASPDIEEAVAYFEQTLRDRGYPLLVTETNRLHRTLKRMLAAGATMLGPYLQSSSWNFDYASSTGNWGDPLGFMTSDYDFGGAVAPNGNDRPDADQGRLLARLIQALGPRLGAAVPGEANKFTPEPDDHPFTVPPRTLDLEGGGTLTSLTNLTAHIVPGVFATGSGTVPVRLQPDSCLLLVANLPLEGIGIVGTLLAATAELVLLRTDGATAILAVHTASDAEVHLTLPAGSLESTPTGGLSLHTVSDDAFVIKGPPGSVSFRDRTGARLQVHVVSTTAAMRSGELGLSWQEAIPAGTPNASVQTIIARALNTPAFLDYSAIAKPSDVVDDRPRPMEYHGIYRGGALYASTLPGGDVRGLVLGRAGDIVTVDIDGIAPTMIVNGGTDLFLDFGETRSIPAGAPVVVRVDVWGHSNFHDERLPSLELGALRGISSAAVITDIVGIEHGWELSSPSGSPAIGRQPEPYASWGKWSNSVRPEHLAYRRIITLPPSANAAAVRIVGTQGVHNISIDGQRVGSITPLSPLLDITAAISAGASFALEVTASRQFSEPLGAIDLLIGTTICGWSVAGFEVEELSHAARAARLGAVTGELPVRVEPGHPRWLHIDLDTVDHAAALQREDIVIRPRGTGLKLTFVHHDHLIGRVWTEPPVGARLTGGRGDIAMAPRLWVREDPVISILLEAVGPGPGTFDSLTLSHTIDVD